MSAHSADRTSSRVSGVALKALAAAVATPPRRSAAGNGGDLTATAASNSPASANDAGGVTGKAPSVRGAYIYGYDGAGNPTLKDAGCHGISDGKLPD